LNSRRE